MRGTSKTNNRGGVLDHAKSSISIGSRISISGGARSNQNDKNRNCDDSAINDENCSRSPNLMIPKGEVSSKCIASKAENIGNLLEQKKKETRSVSAVSNSKDAKNKSRDKSNTADVLKVLGSFIENMDVRSPVNSPVRNHLEKSRNKIKSNSNANEVDDNDKNKYDYINDNERSIGVAESNSLVSKETTVENVIELRKSTDEEVKLEKAEEVKLEEPLIASDDNFSDNVEIEVKDSVNSNDLDVDMINKESASARVFGQPSQTSVIFSLPVYRFNRTDIATTNNTTNASYNDEFSSVLGASKNEGTPTSVQRDAEDLLADNSDNSGIVDDISQCFCSPAPVSRSAVKCYRNLGSIGKFFGSTSRSPRLDRLDCIEAVSPSSVGLNSRYHGDGDESFLTTFTGIYNDNTYDNICVSAKNNDKNVNIYDNKDKNNLNRNKDSNNDDANDDDNDNDNDNEKCMKIFDDDACNTLDTSAAKVDDDSDLSLELDLPLQLLKDSHRSSFGRKSLSRISFGGGGSHNFDSNDLYIDGETDDNSNVNNNSRRSSRNSNANGESRSSRRSSESRRKSIYEGSIQFDLDDISEQYKSATLLGALSPAYSRSAVFDATVALPDVAIVTASSYESHHEMQSHLAAYHNFDNFDNFVDFGHSNTLSSGELTSSSSVNNDTCIDISFHSCTDHIENIDNINNNSSTNTNITTNEQGQVLEGNLLLDGISEDNFDGTGCISSLPMHFLWPLSDTTDIQRNSSLLSHDFSSPIVDVNSSESGEEGDSGLMSDFIDCPFIHLQGNSVYISPVFNSDNNNNNNNNNNNKNNNNKNRDNDNSFSFANEIASINLQHIFASPSSSDILHVNYDSSSETPSTPVQLDSDHLLEGSIPSSNGTIDESVDVIEEIGDNNGNSDYNSIGISSSSSGEAICGTQDLYFENTDGADTASFSIPVTKTDILAPSTDVKDPQSNELKDLEEEEKEESNQDTSGTFDLIWNNLTLCEGEIQSLRDDEKVDEGFTSSSPQDSLMYLRKFGDRRQIIATESHIQENKFDIGNSDLIKGISDDQQIDKRDEFTNNSNSGSSSSNVRSPNQDVNLYVSFRDLQYTHDTTEDFERDSIRTVANSPLVRFRNAGRNGHLMDDDIEDFKHIDRLLENNYCDAISESENDVKPSGSETCFPLSELIFKSILNSDSIVGSISGYSIMDGHIEYKLVVNIGATASLFLYKRFSEFETLQYAIKRIITRKYLSGHLLRLRNCVVRENIEKINSDLDERIAQCESILDFPDKNWIGSNIWNRWSNEHLFIENRKEALANWFFVNLLGKSRDIIRANKDIQREILIFLEM